MKRLGVWGAILAVGLTAAAVSAQEGSVSWKACLTQSAAWYGGAEAVRIADNVLLYQRDNGGWNKNVDMAVVLSDREKAALRAAKKDPQSTIDNGATHTQLRYLARVHTATRHPRFREAFLQGVDYLLAAQYDNGGWPQYYPLRPGYYTHITFNDGAMIGVLNLLRDIARREPGFAFVDDARRARAGRAVERGIDCLLKTQVVVNGRRTVWCAQHDAKTLAPAPARAYEKVSLSGSESVGIAQFLMGIEQPEPAVVAAVQGAAAWFRQAAVPGMRYEHRRGPAYEKGHDRILVADPAAPPLWARFYEIGTNRPIFSGRDGIVKYRLTEIEHERRIGYAWYTNAPARLLDADYPAWRKKWLPDGAERRAIR